MSCLYVQIVKGDEDPVLFPLDYELKDSGRVWVENPLSVLERNLQVEANVRHFDHTWVVSIIEIDEGEIPIYDDWHGWREHEGG